MSKAVLVLDMPESCIDCPCHFSDTTMWCGINETELQAEDIETYKPDWCPLRELPKKKEKYMYIGVCTASNIDGWNTCIDAIAGGKNDGAGSRNQKSDKSHKVLPGNWN